MIRTALQLASCGLHVFPCRPRDKRPATTRGLRDATTDEDAIRRWWRLEPQYNVAIASCRRVSRRSPRGRGGMSISDARRHRCAIRPARLRLVSIPERTEATSLRRRQSTRVGDDMPGASTRRIRSPQRLTGCSTGSPSTPEWRALVADGADEGQRDCSVTRLAGHLLRRHVDPCVVLDLLQVWNVARCTPPPLVSCFQSSPTPCLCCNPTPP